MTNTSPGQLSYIHTTKEPKETATETPSIPEEVVLTKGTKEAPPAGFADNSRQSESDIDLVSQTESTMCSFSDPGSIYRSERVSSSPHFVSFPPTSHNQDGPSQWSFDSSFPQSRGGYQIGPLKGLPDSPVDESYATLEEACLLRYFTENLSYWVSGNLPKSAAQFLLAITLADLSLSASLTRVTGIDTLN